MNILMLNYEYPPLGGGGGVATQTLVQALAQRGVKVTVVTSGEGPSVQTEHPHPNLEIIRLPVTGRTQRPVASLQSLFSYIRHVKRWGKSISTPHFDLVHSQFAVPTGLAGRYLARRWGLPHAVTVHGFDIYDPTRKISAHCFPPVHRTVQLVLNSAAAITTQSQDIAERTRRGYHLKKELQIIPLGIPWVARPTPTPQSNNLFELIGVGRLVARKGFETAIQAMPLLPKQVRLTVIGDGPEKKPLQNLAKELGVEHRVSLLGAVFDQEKWRALASAQVYVLPSLHEGFSLATVEAMMMGLPVVASNVGGQIDYLKPQHNALLIPPQNPQALADAVSQLMSQPELRQRMSQENLTLAQQFTDRAMAEDYQHLYESLLSK